MFLTKSQVAVNEKKCILFFRQRKSTYHFTGENQMNKLQLTIIAVFSALCVSGADMPRIFMAGDSTMCDRKSAVKMGSWGQLLRKHVKQGVVINNMAKSGFSSKSFISKGLWNKLVSQLQEGDYVIVQFGHNDQKKKDPRRYTDANGEYKDNLRKFITESGAKGAKVVLATSICRRTFGKDGKLTDAPKLKDYADATMAVAKECNVPVVDLNTLTRELLNSLGDEKSRELYFFFYNKKDNTHTTGKGANIIAGLFVEDAKKQQLEIAKLFK